MRAGPFGVFAPIDRDLLGQPAPSWWFHQFTAPGALERWTVQLPPGERFCLRRVVVQYDWTDAGGLPHGDALLEICEAGGRVRQNAPVSARASCCMIINAPSIVPARDRAWGSAVWGATLSASSPIVGHTLNLHYFASDSFMCRISFDAGATRPDCLWLLLLGYAIPEQSLRQWGRG